MDKVLELLESIPVKTVEPGKACQRLKQLVKSLQQEFQYTLAPTNHPPECIQILCTVKDKDESEHKALIPKEKTSEIVKAVSTLKCLSAESKFPLTRLLSAFLGNSIPLCLELLVLLENSDIMQVTTYLIQYTEKYEDTSWFTNSLVWLVKDDTSKHHSIIVPLLSALLAVRDCGSVSCAQDLALLSSTLTDHFCTQVTEWLLELSEEVSSNKLNYLSKLDATGQLSKSSIRSLAYAHLTKLTSTSNCKQLLPMYEVPLYQSSKWKLCLVPLPFKSLLLEVVAVVGTDEVLGCILSNLGKSNVNWRILLLLTSSVLHAESGVKKTMDFIDQLLRRGLECDSELYLGASLLFARQCCQEASSEFGTYSQWFGAHFGIGTGSARSANQFQSLLQLLVALVPAEPPAMLRVHLNAVPKAPPSCHSLLRDYTELARARLDELNEPTEMGGLFMDSCDGEQDTRAQDVGRVLQHFLRTEKVLKVVLEAAVFRRKYFEGVFLIELLQLPGWSQRELTPEEHRARHAFIEKLKALDKIPQKLHAAYKSAEEMKDSGKFEPRTMKHQLSATETETEWAQKNKGRLQIKKKRPT